MFKDYKLKNFNFKILLYVLVLCGISYLAIGSAVAGNSNDGLQNKQFLGMVLGVCMALVLTFIDYHLYMKLFWVIQLVDILLLLLVRIKGVSSHNAQRWVQIAGVQIQPSEFSKIMLILVLAALLGIIAEKINKVWTIMISLAVCGMVWALIYKQPDLSTTIVCVFLFCAMYYIAGISYKWVFGIIGVSVPILVWLIWALLTGNVSDKLIKPYQQTRILSFIFPKEYADAYYQQEYSIIAIGSGGLSGKGINANSYESVKTGNFLSEAQTDFIFTIVGEEMGFIGCCTVLVLLVLICLECFLVASRAADLQGKLIASGVGCLIAFQSIINISVTTGMMCNTGIPLPFMSAGLSSLVSMFAGIGLVMNVAMQRGEKSYRAPVIVSDHQITITNPEKGDRENDSNE